MFFDRPPLEHVEHEMAQAMKAAGLDPAFVYAFEKTGLLVTEQNQHLISETGSTRRSSMRCRKV